MATAKSKPLKVDGPATTSVAVKKSSGALVSIKEQMAKDLANLAGKTAPASGNMIRVTQDKKFLLPNGQKSDGPLELVIVDFNSKNTYYEGAYDSKNISPPACFAIGDIPTAMVPSDNAPDKQSDSCGGCPMNQFGSAGDGKACKNSRVLAVLPPDADADTPLMLISVSPTALKGFDGYIGAVARQFQVPPYGVVTSVSFDPSKTYATLVFGDPRPNEAIEEAFSRRDEAKALLAVEPDVSGYEAPAPKKRVVSGRK